ncbi:S15/NS1, RNA-binding protein [Actinidia rufa]|uniref:S15/NS1, RNA-binding protein n=1 Tax=Actinidia rufa TaxID=165716 RepID=A0A7J0H2I1_9ERIC|nr:S15/NS1, RNA-binding protein [Actinidia rufa]
MSSSEKLKLELQKVRDEFKMSESDCGSARVQGTCLFYVSLAAKAAAADIVGTSHPVQYSHYSLGGISHDLAVLGAKVRFVRSCFLSLSETGQGQAFSEGSSRYGSEEEEVIEVSTKNRLGFLLPCTFQTWA